MLTREELIRHYEKNLEKVKIMHRTDTNSDLINEKGRAYVEFAEKELEAVKSGREW